MWATAGICIPLPTTPATPITPNILNNRNQCCWYQGYKFRQLPHKSPYSNSQSYGHSVFFEKFLETGAVGRNYIDSD